MPSLMPSCPGSSGPERDRDELMGSLYRQHHHGLLRYLVARFGRTGLDHEDIIQSAFLKLADHPDIGDIADHRAYVFTLACNIAIDDLRKTMHRRSLQNMLHVIESAAPPVDSSSSEKILIDRERLGHIETALRKMPTMRRRIFLLIRVEGLSVRDVAARFAISEAAVYKHVARALHDCAAMLERAEKKASY